MIPFHRTARLVAAFLAVMTGAVVVPVAAAHGPDPVLGGGLFAQNQSLEFRWRAGSEPPTAIRTAIRAAADNIGDTRASKAATFLYDSTGANPIGYGPGATCGVNGLACFTRSAPGGFTMWLREQGHVFDWGTLRWCQMYTTAPNGCYDAQTITLDEFGHVEILNHHVNYSDDRDYLDAVVQTFSRTKPNDGWNMHVLGRCDVATLQREYDVISWSTAYSTCLDLDTVLTLSANPTAIAYGSTTDPHRVAQGGRPRRLRPPGRESGQQPGREAPASHPRQDDVGRCRNDGRRRLRQLFPDGLPHAVIRIPGHLLDSVG